MSTLLPQDQGTAPTAMTLGGPMLSPVHSPILGPRPLVGSLRHLGQISQGWSFPWQEFCLPAFLAPGSHPHGNPEAGAV